MPEKLFKAPVRVRVMPVATVMLVLAALLRFKSLKDPATDIVSAFPACTQRLTPPPTLLGVTTAVAQLPEVRRCQFVVVLVFTAPILLKSPSATVCANKLVTESNRRAITPNRPL